MARPSAPKAGGLRTSVRLSLQFSFLYAVLSAVVFAMAYWFTQYEVHDWVIDQMRGDAGTLQAIYQTGGAAILVDHLNALAAVSFEDARVYQLQDANGAVLAGNIDLPIGRPLPAMIPADQIAAAGSIIHEVNGYWMQETPIGPYRLIQGSGDHIVREVLEALGTALVLGYLTVIVLGLVAGIRVGRITEKRIAAILNALTRLSDGQLAVRLPVPAGGGDDLSRVSVKVNDMLDEIAQLAESQRQIANDIAHDMRTPLQRLHQRLERLRATPGVAADEIDACLGQTRDIISTFNALLRIAQLEGGDRQARFGLVDLAPILSTVIDAFRPVAEDRGIDLRLSDPPQALMVRGDQGLLTQMFSNVVENAIKHCPSGTTVAVDGLSHDRTIVVRIADNGPGISAQDRERVFQRFFRTERSRHTPGNGLGLALVKAIAQIHHGTVSVQGNNPGAVFRFEFAACK